MTAACRWYLARLGAGLRRALRPRTRRGRWARRILAALAAALCLGAPAAQADTGSAASQVLGWMSLWDSHGIPVSSYQLSVKTGGVTDWDQGLVGFLATGLWTGYIIIASLGIWFLGWILSFDWFGIVSAPLVAIADSVDGIMGRLGVVPVFLAAAALLGGLRVMRGKHAAGLYDLGAAAIIAALMAGSLAHPIHLLVDQPAGWLWQIRDGVLEGVAEIADPGGQQPGFAPGLADGTVVDNQGRAWSCRAGQQPRCRIVDANGNAQTSGVPGEEDLVPPVGYVAGVQQNLVDVLVREPTMLINFGKVLDPKCSDTWETGLLGQNDGGDSWKKTLIPGYTAVQRLTGQDEGAIRAAVGDCDKAAGDYAAHPGFGMTATGGLLTPCAVVVLALLLVIGVSVAVSMTLALYQGVKLTVTGIAGILPGIGRRSLADTVADFIVHAGGFVFAMVFLGGLTVVVGHVFSANTGSAVKTYLIGDIVILMAIIAFLRQRKKLAASRDRISDLLLTQPGGKTPSRGVPGPNGRRAVAVAVMAARMATRAGGHKAPPRNAPPPPRDVPPPPKGAPAPPAPGDAPPTPAPGDAPPPSGGPDGAPPPPPRSHPDDAGRPDRPPDRPAGSPARPPKTVMAARPAARAGGNKTPPGDAPPPPAGGGGHDTAPPPRPAPARRPPRRAGPPDAPPPPAAEPPPAPAPAPRAPKLPPRAKYLDPA